MSSKDYNDCNEEENKFDKTTTIAMVIVIKITIK